MPETQIEKLNEKNCVDWHYMMEALLIEKDLWNIVDRTEGHPAGTDNSKAICTYVKKQQVAQAVIILHIIEPSQLPHTHFSDPTQIWENLEVPGAHGFATCLALWREILYMKKCDNQVMNSWIVDVKNTAYHLDAAGVTIIDEDIILTLTAGLLELYATLIVMLSNLPPNELMLSNVITHLLNEEV